MIGSVLDVTQNSNLIIWPIISGMDDDGLHIQSLRWSIKLGSESALRMLNCVGSHCAVIITEESQDPAHPHFSTCIQKTF